MTQTPLPPAPYIRSDSELQALIPHFSSEPFLAIDTESNSLYAYREQVCLFQITTRSGDFIIDPFEIQDMEPLGAVLANPRIEKIFHQDAKVRVKITGPGQRRCMAQLGLGPKPGEEGYDPAHDPQLLKGGAI